MTHFFDPDAPIMRALSAVFDFMALSIVALACALPLVTAGASIAALYAAMAERTAGGVGNLRVFFQQFRRCFRKATVLWVSLLAAGALLLMDLRIVTTMVSAVRIPLWAGLFFMTACLLLSGVYLFPLTALDPAAPFLSLWKRAWFLGIARLPQSLAMAAMAAVPAAAMLFTPYWFIVLSPIWFLFWPALTTFLWAKLTDRVLRPEQYEM